MLDQHSLFSPWRAAIISSVRPYYAEPLGHIARGPCHVAVSPLQVFRDCDDDSGDDDNDSDDDCRASVHG